MSIEDPSCLVSAGIVSSNYTTPVIQRSPITPTFDTARRQLCAAPEDPGCLQHLNIAIEIETAPASVAARAPVTGKTSHLSTYEWGMQELEIAEETLRKEEGTTHRALTLA